MPGEVPTAYNIESPDAKEAPREEEINPSSNKKKNLLNESTDEEDNMRRREAFENTQDQILRQYELNRQAALDDSSSSDDDAFGIEDENAQFRFAQKLNKFDNQNKSTHQYSDEEREEL